MFLHVRVRRAPGPPPNPRCFNTVLAAIAAAAARDGRHGGAHDRTDAADHALNQSYENDVWWVTF
jgi:hypothetical protein